MPSNNSGNSSLFLGLAFAGLAVASGGSSVAVSIAWFVGSTIGSLLGVQDTETTQEGPRQTEFKTTASQYGIPIPRGYGAARMGGNVVWASRVTETVIQRTICTEQDGLLGSDLGRQENCTTIIRYVYTRSWFTALCEGPIDNVVRVWADGKTIYNLTNSGRVAAQIVEQQTGKENSNPVIRVITGGADQGLDSHMARLIEADGQAIDKQSPAYRGIAGILFVDADLGPYGYRIPSVNAEVLYASGAPSDCVTIRDLTPQFNRYGTFTPSARAFQNPDQPGIVIFFERLDGVNYIFGYNTTQKQFFFDRNAPWKSEGEVLGLGFDNTVYVRFSGGRVNRYNFYTGKRTSEYVYDSGSRIEINFAEHHELKEVVFMSNDGFMRGNVTDLRAALKFSNKGDIWRVQKADDQENNRYVQNTSLRSLLPRYVKADPRIDIGSTVVIVGDDALDTYAYGLSFASGATEQGVTGLVMIQIWTGGSSADARIVRDPETGLPISATSGKMFYEKSDHTLIIICNIFNQANCFKYDILTGRTLKSAQIPYFINTTIGVDYQMVNGSFNAVWEYCHGNTLYELDTLSLEIVSEVAQGDWWGACSGNFGRQSLFIPEANCTVVLLTGGLESYIGYHIGQPQNIELDSVLEDQMLNEHFTRRFGLDESDLDFTEVQNRYFKGVVYNSQQPVRGNLQPLQQAFYLDYYESDGKIKVRSRQGKKIVAVIPEEDLSARDGGAEQSSRVTLVRKPEIEMPRELTVNFTDYDRDYEQSTARATRQVTDASAKINISLPIMFTASEAKQIAENLLDNTWLDRTSFSIALPMKYLFIEPSDVFEVTSSGITYTMRATEVAIGANRMLLINATAEDITKYNSDASTDVPVGWQVDETIGNTHFLAHGLEVSLLKLLNVDQPNNAVVLGAFAPAGTTFNEISVVRTDDTGIRPVGRIVSPAVGGIVDGDSPFLSSPAGAQSVDYSISVIVNLYSESDLQSISRQELLEDGNLCLIGNEVLAFETATALDGTRWELSGLLRGRSNTAHNMGNHVPGEQFMILNSLMVDTRFNGQEGRGAFYTLVQGSRELTVGVVLDGSSSAPNCVSGLKFFLFDDSINIEWDVVDRINQGLSDGTDVDDTPADAPLLFRVEFLDLNLNVVHVEETRNTRLPVTDAQITEYLGAYRTNIGVRVYQIGPSGVISPPVLATSFFQATLQFNRTYISIGFTQAGPGLMPTDMRPFWAPGGYAGWVTEDHPVGDVLGLRSILHNDPLVSGDAFLALYLIDYLPDFSQQILFVRASNNADAGTMNVRLICRAQVETIGGQSYNTGLVCGISGSGTHMIVTAYVLNDQIEVHNVELPAPIVPDAIYAFRTRMHGNRLQAKVWELNSPQPGWLIDDSEGQANYPVNGTAGFGAEDGTLGVRVLHYETTMNGESLWL